MDCPLRFWKNEEVRQAIRNLCREFDYVVIDTPQSSNLSDNMLLAELAENCLYVVRRDHAKLREICEGAEIFEESDCRFLGYVMRG
jgi:Mrp family chromosome partitioning ATPase